MYKSYEKKLEEYTVKTRRYNKTSSIPECNFKCNKIYELILHQIREIYEF